MRLLFEKIYTDEIVPGPVRTRPSVRGIIIRDGKIAMVHSLILGFYKFPGGGMEKGENLIDTLVREVSEEAGLDIIRGSVREYGYVRVQKGKHDGPFIQDSYHFFCDIEPGVHLQHLDPKEADAQFVLEYVDPMHALRTNRSLVVPGKEYMLFRESGVLELLINEGYFGSMSLGL